MLRSFPLLFAMTLFWAGCQTSKPVLMGIQPEFAAVNPSRILAVPVFTLPDPGRPTQVDLSIVEADGTRRVIESAVLEAFRNQPGVNGVSFQAVTRALGAPPNVQSRMAEIMKKTAARLTSTLESERMSLGKECLARRNFLDFYVHCLARQKEWVDELNALSALILNADTALLTVITELQKRGDAPPTAALEGAAAILIVDTNSGKLIWGRQSRDAVAGPRAGATPEVSELFPRILSERFWEEFPGRRQSALPPAKAQETGGLLESLFWRNASTQRTATP